MTDKERTIDAWHAFADAVETLTETLPDEAWTERLEYTVDEGLYENTALITPDGEEYPAGQLYYWATDLHGHHCVDIRQRNVPPDVDLAECRLEIRSADGVALLAGDVIDEPNETLGESYSVKIT